MEIKNYIKIYDDVMPLIYISKMIRFFNQSKNFFPQGVGDLNEINEEMRTVEGLELYNHSQSLTEVHWHNFLHKVFGKFFYDYNQTVAGKQIDSLLLNNIIVLKYKAEKNGHYDWHTDHFAGNPRTLSAILLMNDDYEGGNLMFREPNGNNEMTIDVKANRMIIWPSNFLYPHCVKPVTKGLRYSIVCWGL